MSIRFCFSLELSTRRLTILTCRFQPPSYVSVMMKVSGCKRDHKFVELVKGELGPACYVIWIVKTKQSWICFAKILFLEYDMKENLVLFCFVLPTFQFI